MLAEDDDPDLWMRRSQLACEANPVVGVARRHPDIGQDDIWHVSVDGRPKLAHVGTDRDDLDVLDRFEQAPDPFPSEKAVVAEDDSDHRRASPPSPIGRETLAH